MKKDDIKEIIIKHSQRVENWINHDGEGYSTDDRWMDNDDINSMTEDIFRLFVVMESDCAHEWLNHSFDHFGFLQEQICDKCGAKQSVP